MVDFTTIRHDWKPTPESIAALPKALRDYIQQIEWERNDAERILNGNHTCC